MSDDRKVKPDDDAFDLGAAAIIDTSSRARNKTVMLTPEITGQVRARMSRGDIAKPDSRPSNPTDESRGPDVATFGSMGTNPLSPDRSSSSPISRQFIEQAVNASERESNSSSFDPGIQFPDKFEPNSAKDADRFGAGRYELETNDYAAPVATSITEKPPTFPQAVPPTAEIMNPVAMTIESKNASVVEEPSMVEENKIVWAKKTVIVGMLVSYDIDSNGEVYLLRTGRIVVSNQEQSGSNSFVLTDETVSPNHAIMRIGDQGDVQVLDQLSEYGTAIIGVNGEEVRLAGEKATVAHGDLIKFGNRAFKVCLI